MKPLVYLISSVIAVTATTNSGDLQKQSRFGRIKPIHGTTTTSRPAASVTRVYQRIAQPTTISAVRTPAGKDLTAAHEAGGMGIARSQRVKVGLKKATRYAFCEEQILKGENLNGKYQVDKMIGKGAFSVVFAAFHDGERFALKCLTKTNDPSSNDEIAALEKLNHPNVIKMVDSFVEGGLLFIVTEMCDLDLARYIEMHKKLDLPTSKDIMLQIASAVIYLHESEIFHLDLKPENILVVEISGKPYAKVSDFGLSTSEISSNDPFLGSPMFKAPEIFYKQVGYPWAKNDVWAMGLIFFNMLTGHSPWIRPTFPGQTVSSWRSNYGFFISSHCFKRHLKSLAQDLLQRSSIN